MGIFKKKGKYYIDFYVDGRRKRKLAGTSKRLAEIKLAAVKTDIERGEYRFKKERKIMFKKLAVDYLEYAKANKKSWYSDEINLKNLKSHFKDMLLSKITPKDIEDYKIKRIEQVSPATVNRELACLKHMFNLARKWKMTDDNPVHEVKFFSERKFVWHILTEEEAERLIEVASEHLKPIILVALNTGMRRGEILNLRWNDVDFAEHFIFLKETKSGIMRKIPMSGFVAATLKGIKRESEFVFCNPRTKEKIGDPKRSFKTACRRIGVPDLRFIDLRHTAATYMVAGNVDLVTVKEILGHSKIETTMRYAHPTPENKRRAVEVLASVFDQKLQKVDTIWTPRESRKDITSSLSKN